MEIELTDFINDFAAAARLRNVPFQARSPSWHHHRYQTAGESGAVAEFAEIVAAPAVG
jgi:hypothetical protein